MPRQRIYDDELYAHFVTFACYHRRRLLDHDRAKRVVLGVLNSQMAKQDARCVGFVVMPDHVHAIVWFPEPKQLSHFMKQWKQRSSVQLRSLFRGELSRYGNSVAETKAMWQRKYYPFHLYSEEKLLEKLEYMHLNPVRAGLVDRAVDWQFSSARWYLEGKSVGVPVGMPR